MQRIFLTLASLSTLLMFTAWGLGWNVGDATVPDPTIQNRVGLHFMVALGALVFATLVHAIVLTYFMGTGRWMEETSAAYHLDSQFQNRNHRLKYRTIPILVICITLLITAGATGGLADPASPWREGLAQKISPAELHFWIATCVLVLNLLGHAAEYVALGRNSELIQKVLAEVRQIRISRGLPVDESLAAKS